MDCGGAATVVRDTGRLCGYGLVVINGGLLTGLRLPRLRDAVQRVVVGRDDDLAVLRKLLGLYFITSVGHQAADRLGDDLFEAGDFGGAEQAWAAIIDEQASAVFVKTLTKLPSGLSKNWR